MHSTWLHCAQPPPCFPGTGAISHTAVSCTRAMHRTPPVSKITLDMNSIAHPTAHINCLLWPIFQSIVANWYPRCHEKRFRLSFSSLRRNPQLPQLSGIHVGICLSTFNACLWLRMRLAKPTAVSPRPDIILTSTLQASACLDTFLLLEECMLSYKSWRSLPMQLICSICLLQQRHESVYKTVYLAAGGQ